jgi:ribosomal protein L16 Arg81 hydroxylase
MTPSPEGYRRLAWLLDPHTPDEFFSQYWEQRPLHLKRGVEGYYTPVMTAEDLGKLIGESDLRYPAVRLAKGGGFYPSEIYARNLKYGDDHFLGVPDLERIATEYRNGATVTLPAIHRTWGPLRDLCAELEAELDHVPHANVYLTPGNAAGFTPHYDVHEVFVLQIAGRKRWTLHEPTVRLPHRTQPWSPQGAKTSQPLATLDLEPGDLLYLPRGYLHSTTTSDSYSAHITLGVSVYTWADLARESLSSLLDSPDWRRALPPGFAHRGELRPVMLQGMHQALEQLVTAEDHGNLADSFTRRVRSNRMSIPDPFRLDVLAIDPEARLQAVDRSAYRLTLEGAHTVLEFKGQRHLLPALVAKTLHTMTEIGPFRSGQLDSDLDAEAKRGLIRYLCDVGFLMAAS